MHTPIREPVDMDFDAIRCEMHPERSWPHDECGGAGCPYATAEDVIRWLVNQRNFLRAVLQTLSHEPPVEGGWDGDCCYGNYDDAHCHGAALARSEIAARARNALFYKDGAV